MFTKSNLLFIYVETPLHPGSGRSLGGIDLEIQRERVTNYPLVQGSSLKGRLRAEIRTKNGWRDDSPEMSALFGQAEDGSGASHAGAISPSDAKILLFPVRCLAGVFAWTTSVNILARFRRDALAASTDVGWVLPTAPSSGSCLVAEGSAVVTDGQVILEEFPFEAAPSSEVGEIANWLTANALPEASEYGYWRDILPSHLVVLPDDEFRDFTRFSTEVVTRVKLVPETKTVQRGALWTEEYLPSDTLLYSSILVGRTRAQNGIVWDADQVLAKLVGLDGVRVHLGGDETTGRGIVHLRFLQGSEVRR